MEIAILAISNGVGWSLAITYWREYRKLHREWTRHYNENK